MNKVLLTGANGLIGSAIVQELVSKRVEVIAIIKDSSENVESISELPGVRLVYCDLKDITSLYELVPDRDIDTCIYLAWAGASGDARTDSKLQLANVQFAMDTVCSISKMGIKRFIGAGTLMELDILNYIPSDGSLPNAVSHYPAAKIATRFMTKIECTRLGIEHIWCLISNTYGPGIRSGFVSYALDRFLKNETAEFTSGEQLYDFMHVLDTAKAFVAASKNGKSNSLYYLGSSKPRKLKEYIMMIRDAVDPSIMVDLGALPFRGESLSPDDLDCTKLADDTGYKASITFEVGIKLTLAWMKKENE